MSDPELIADLGTLRDDADGRRAVAMSRTLPVPAADLWAALTSPDQLARWFGQVDGDLREGGAFRVSFEGGAVTPMTLQRCAAPRELEVGWTFPAEPDSLLHVRVEDTDAGSTLVLDHRLLPHDQAVGYAAGWHTYLDRLEDVLAGGSAREWDARFAEVLQTYRGVAMR